MMNRNGGMNHGPDGKLSLKEPEEGSIVSTPDGSEVQISDFGHWVSKVRDRDPTTEPLANDQEIGSQAPPPCVSIVMPVYNEEEALPIVLQEAVDALHGAPFSFELVFVNDASTDQSLHILEDFQQTNPELKVQILSHETNQGIMASLSTLFAQARGSYVFMISSDGQCRASECVRMMELRDQFDIVVGQRLSKKYTAWRAMISYAFNALPRVLFGVRTYDAGSIKLYRSDALKIPLLSQGPFREAERLIRAHRRGYRIGMITVDHSLRKGGKATGARFGLVLRAIVDLWRCWWDIVIRGRT